MRRVNGIISRRQWQQDTAASIVSTFQLVDYGRSVSAALLGRLIVMAACVGTSLSGAAARVRRSPSVETVRKALLAHLPEDLSNWERQINDSLLRLAPKAFFKRHRRLAIDLHQRPYYGQREGIPVRGGKKKKGTRWFWTWATVAVVEHGQRWTIAMTPVGPDDLLENIVARLLEHVKRAQILVKMALVDREFYSANVIAVLQSRNIPFLMPAIRRGQLQGVNGPTGTQRFFKPGTTGFFEHTWTARGRSNGGEGNGADRLCATKGRRPSQWSVSLCLQWSLVGRSIVVSRRVSPSIRHRNHLPPVGRRLGQNNDQAYCLADDVDCRGIADAQSMGVAEPACATRLRYPLHATASTQYPTQRRTWTDSRL